MIIAGLGFSSKAGASDILDAVRAALTHYECHGSDLGGLASIEAKRASAVLEAVADELAVPLEFSDGASLEDVSDRLITRSEISLEKTGLPSVSEAAALACAGSGGVLLGPRIIHGSVTCALAKTAGSGSELEETKS